MNRPILWEELTWPEAEEIIKTKKMVIVPFAAIEQHGPHLPLGTDYEQVYYVAKRVSAETGVPVAPCMPYGCSTGHEGFPGVTSITADTLMHVARDLCIQFYKTGIRRILQLNGHMYNQGSLISARESLKGDYPELYIKTLNYWEVTKEVLDIMAEDCPRVLGRPVNVHGNIGETSNMLAIKPELVKMERAKNEKGLASHFDYLFRQVSQSGSIGRPSDATADRGKKILELVVNELAEFVRIQLTEEPPFK